MCQALFCPPLICVRISKGPEAKPNVSFWWNFFQLKLGVKFLMELLICVTHQSSSTWFVSCAQSGASAILFVCLILQLNIDFCYLCWRFLSSWYTLSEALKSKVDIRVRFTAVGSGWISIHGELVLTLIGLDVLVLLNTYWEPQILSTQLFHCNLLLSLTG